MQIQVNVKMLFQACKSINTLYCFVGDVFVVVLFVCLYFLPGMQLCKGLTVQKPESD